MKTKEIVYRIESIMLHYDLSAAVFADKIGVQRSGISHLLKGRNKPSLDFILKIKDAFPDVDVNWLLFGRGSLDGKQNQDKENPNALSPTKATLLPKPTPRDKQIDSIVIFYTDGTFKTHKEV